MTIYRVCVRVRPLPAHPLYYEIQFGHLFVWIAATDEDDARRRSLAAVSPALFELVGSKVLLQQIVREVPPDCEKFVIEAKNVGLSLQLKGYATGVDEGDFATELGDDFDA